MTRIALLLLVIALARPSAAQTVTIQADASDLRLGPVVVIPVRLDRGMRSGYLIELAWSPGVYAVAVSNQLRSGFGGTVPVGGLCIEHPFQLPSGDWWQFTPPRDGDGDGDDDLVLLEVSGAQRFRVINLDLILCQ